MRKGRIGFKYTESCMGAVIQGLNEYKKRFYYRSQQQQKQKQHKNKQENRKYGTEKIKTQRKIPSWTLQKEIAHKMKFIIFSIKK